MTDHWDGWPEDDLPDADTADLTGPGYDPPGYEQGFGGPELDPLDPLGLGHDPYGGHGGEHAEPFEEPFGEPGDGPTAQEGFGAAEPAPDLVTTEHTVDDPPVDDAVDSTVDDADPPVGADPDVDPHGDDGPGHEFPAPLTLGEPPEPVDGFPWTDAGFIGGNGAEPLADPAADPAVSEAAPAAGDLFAYAGEEPPAGLTGGSADAAGWSQLIASPDPATSTLARFWTPHH